MAETPGFVVDYTTLDINMNKGDTGSYWIHAARENGEDWPDTARLLFTIRDSKGEIVLQRLYRLDDQWGEGDGYVLIEFHNSDTDEWATGSYDIEYRFNVVPIWQGTPSTARCVDALRSDAVMVEGNGTVRTKYHAKLKIDDVFGRI